MGKKYCIGFSTSNTFLGKAIEFITGSDLSHTFQYVDEENIIDAWGGEGVRIVSEEEFLSQNKVYQIYEPIAPPELLEYAMRKVKEQEGKGYDYLNVAGMAIVTLLEHIGIKINNFLFSKNRFQCSELSLYDIRKIFKYTDIPMQPETIRPDSLWRYFRRHPEMFKERKDLI